MDLSFGPEYSAFRDKVRTFVTDHKHKQPRPGSTPKSNELLDWQALLIEQGYHSRTIPAEYGGYGAEPDIIESRIIAEEFAREQMNTGLAGQGISMLTPVLLEMGT